MDNLNLRSKVHKLYPKKKRGLVVLWSWFAKHFTRRITGQGGGVVMTSKYEGLVNFLYGAHL